MSVIPSHGVSGWQRDTPPAAPQPGLSGATEARVVVVGAGLAGLALTHALTQFVAPDDILLIEAGRAGDGASGRSTGIVGPGVGGPIGALVKKRGRDLAGRMFGTSLEGVAALRRLVKGLPADCELTDTYQLVAAKTPAHAQRLRQQAETLAGLGFDVRYLDRAATADRLGTEQYDGALCYPDIAVVNPWLLCQVLKGALLAAGVRIAETTPVTAIAGGDPVTLTAGGHRVRAGTVALATDGFTHSVGLYRNIAPVRTHVLRTEILPPELLARIGWNGEGAVIDSRSFFNYFRMTAQGRLVFGGGPALPEGRTNAGRIEAVRTRIVGELAEVFPALAEVGISDFWSGVTASTTDRLPIVGQVPNLAGVWFAGAWCGHGIAMSAITAEMLAPRLAGVATEWPASDQALPWLRGQAGWAPSGAAGDLVLAGYLAGLGVSDRLAMRGQGRTDRKSRKDTS